MATSPPRSRPPRRRHRPRRPHLRRRRWPSRPRRRRRRRPARRRRRPEDRPGEEGGGQGAGEDGGAAPRKAPPAPAKKAAAKKGPVVLDKFLEGQQKSLLEERAPPAPGTARRSGPRPTPWPPTARRATPSSTTSRARATPSPSSGSATSCSRPRRSSSIERDRPRPGQARRRHLRHLRGVGPADPEGAAARRSRGPVSASSTRPLASSADRGPRPEPSPQAPVRPRWGLIALVAASSSPSTS